MRKAAVVSTMIATFGATFRGCRARMAGGFSLMRCLIKLDQAPIDRKYCFAILNSSSVSGRFHRSPK
jgi:hypothetical protein